MKKFSNAFLGRVASSVVEGVSGCLVRTHYVNKTRKYISIKIVHDHLTNAQLESVANRLRNLFPDRFLTVYNAWAQDSRAQYMFTSDRVDVYPSGLYREPKVLVRFTQE